LASSESLLATGDLLFKAVARTGDFLALAGDYLNMSSSEESSLL